MKVYTVTFLASSLSGIVLLCCLMAIGQIYSNVQEFWDELDVEMSAIRSQTDQMWKDLVHIGATRRRRDVYTTGSRAGYTSSGGGPGYVEHANPSAPAHSFGSAPAGPGPTSAGCQCKSAAENKCRHGPVGPKGAEGPLGRPGRDAEYCPCPARRGHAAIKKA
ncbi:unnamed protein product [Nippostrongylus brasiliensis]|uniref:Col_cuticle_N domain-containing protein n=1 Tax=Nippostrongylus brasiliensis TaxID=27835 RepID=A0A0N4XZH2_NIPBR|nr:unnamed protein product [Nippostrongylus brasiliensis]